MVVLYGAQLVSSSLNWKPLRQLSTLHKPSIQETPETLGMTVQSTPTRSFSEDGISHPPPILLSDIFQYQLSLPDGTQLTTPEIIHDINTFQDFPTGYFAEFPTGSAVGIQ